MFLIIGLGNPGRKYRYTRHNLGFRVVEQFRKENNFSEFRAVKKFKAQVSKGVVDHKEVVLVKPQTFMNNSGIAVRALIANLEFLDYLFVVHDDIDLPLGKIRISKARGSAGHKGVESIIKELGAKDFIRVRIGIQSSAGKPENLDKFVLQKFNKEEEKIIKKIIKKASQTIKIALGARAMTQFNI